MAIFDEIRKDREAGTPGGWRGDGGTVWADARKNRSGNKHGAVCCVVNDKDDGWLVTHDVERIARVPKLEAIALAAEELVKVIGSPVRSDDGLYDYEQAEVDAAIHAFNEASK